MLRMVEFEQMPSAGGADIGDHPVAGQANFLAGVEIVIVGGDFDPLTVASLGVFQQRVGGNQVVCKWRLRKWGR